MGRSDSAAAGVAQGDGGCDVLTALVMMVGLVVVLASTAPVLLPPLSMRRIPAVTALGGFVFEQLKPRQGGRPRLTG